MDDSGNFILLIVVVQLSSGFFPHGSPLPSVLIINPFTISRFFARRAFPYPALFPDLVSEEAVRAMSAS
jgi:hypothetical protein